MNFERPQDRYPLSPMQQGMLFHHLKEPHSGVDVEQLVVHLHERVDAPRLEKAWRWLVDRHEILRTRFVWEGVERPEQEVLAQVEVPFEVVDGLATPKSERLKAFLDTDRVAGFELERAPLLRLTLFQWAEESFSLVWTFHHALLDGRCFPVLLQEVFAAYAELSLGQICIRPAPPRYRRYIDWLGEQEFGVADGFWKELLRGFSAPTPLVVDRKIPLANIAYQQGEAWEALSSAATSQLHRLAKAQALTVNAIVMGAWAILLHRYSGEDDIVFGATRACRKSSVAGADDTMGLFINTVPVRVKIEREQPLLAVLKAVRQQWLDVRPFEHTPLVRMKSASQVPPAQSLFDTLLVFENYKLDTAMRALGGDWSSRQVDLHELTNFPITLAAYDGQNDGEEISFKMEFDRRRLDDSTVARMLGHLRSLLESIAANPQGRVCDAPLLNTVERRELLEAFNQPADVSATQLPYSGDATLHQLFEAQAARRPDAIALTCDGETLTYSQLNARANRVARELVRHGVKPDALVGLCLERSNKLVIALLAILKAGGAYLPIDLAYPAERLAFMLEDAGAPVLLTESKLRANLPATKATIVDIDEVFAGLEVEGEQANLPASANAENLAYVIYTSGTTGKPKGSLITHRNAVRLFPATEHWYGFDERDVWTLFHSSAFDFSVWEIWGALLYGGRLVVVPFLVSRSPETFYELLAAEQVTVLNQTPSAFRQLIQAEESAGQKQLALRYVIFGGEALEMQSLRPWFERHGDQTPLLVNMYGITETTVHVTYRPLSKDDLDSGSVIGVPLPDLQIYILDALRQPVPIGVPGEMYVGGAGLARGYLGRPELTAERFIPDHLSGRSNSRLYRTGDLARFLPGRDIEYLGRIDDQVKIRGFRIELGEIESVLCTHPAVREAAVIAREDVPGSKRLVAYLVTSSAVPEISALRDHLKKTIPEYMVPAAFVFLERFPLTNNGKANRKALPVPEHRPELSNRFVAPRTSVEEKLAEIWSKVLRLERVGIHDNFFELGGDSILGIQVISTAGRAGLKLTPKLLFAHQTIAELATAATMARETQTAAAADDPTGDVPLTPIQKWFFEQNLAQSQHYNQAFLFEVGEALDRGLLERALGELSRHHDALRLRFREAAGGWLQTYAPLDSPPVLNWTDLSALPEAQQSSSLQEAVAAAQASLNIADGPLLKAVYFDLGPQRTARLLIVVHHLAVDGVSWQPLLEDLEALYSQLKNGQAPQLPAKTSSFKTWAKRLGEFADSEALHKELPFWEAATDPARVAEAVVESIVEGTVEGRRADNTEGSAETLTVTLSKDETDALLKQVPSVYNTQINDVLLTALGRAWNRFSGSRLLFTNLEGHGRENLFENVDLSRTVGWFTSIYPVCLELGEAADAWQPGAWLKSVKEQLRQIPNRGIGYGILRYLSHGSGLESRSEPAMVFNYLGQIDQLVSGSALFKFAKESTGAWHSPQQKRRHALEVNSMVVEGRLEFRWTYSPQLHSQIAMKRLTDGFVSALKELIEHCLSPEAGGRTASDFPLAGLEQAALDGLIQGQRDVEDIYPLSPIQTLFVSANPGVVQTVFDQWQCALEGELNVDAFQQAWSETVARHAILRSTVHTEGLRTPLQVVHRNVRLRWTVEDWSGESSNQNAERWSAYLKQDRAQPLKLTEAPAMRFTLVRLSKTEWKFLWSVPPLLLDGWSWPLVFRDASQLYEMFSSSRKPSLAAVRPYRDYVEWLGRQSWEEAAKFWKNTLAGFKEPTALGGVAPDSASAAKGGEERFLRHSVNFSVEATAALQSVARRLQMTLGTLVQGAWAMQLARQSGNSDVVFGAAFAGRPTDLPGYESIAGPFVNNLPVRAAVKADLTVDGFLRDLHSRLLRLNPFQFTPLIDIQELSEVPWRHRMFDSLVVFQNYQVDEAARRFGGEIGISAFDGPIHTNYPLLLLAEPGEALALTLIYDRQTISQATAERWGRDLRIVLERLPEFLDQQVAELQGLLSPAVQGAKVERKLRSDSQDFVPPQSEMERTIAGVWQKMFGEERISIEDNFFDLGGHSLLLLRMHALLVKTLNTEFPVVALLQFPSIRLLANHLDNSTASNTQDGAQLRERAQRRGQALTQMRVRLRK